MTENRQVTSKEAMDGLLSIQKEIKDSMSNPDIDKLEPIMMKTVEFNSILAKRISNVKDMKEKLMGNINE